MHRLTALCHPQSCLTCVSSFERQRENERPGWLVHLILTAVIVVIVFVVFVVFAVVVISVTDCWVVIFRFSADICINHTLPPCLPLNPLLKLPRYTFSIPFQHLLNTFSTPSEHPFFSPLKGQSWTNAKRELDRGGPEALVQWVKAQTKVNNLLTILTSLDPTKPLSYPVKPLSNPCHTPVKPLSNPCQTPVKSLSNPVKPLSNPCQTPVIPCQTPVKSLSNPVKPLSPLHQGSIDRHDYEGCAPITPRHPSSHRRFGIDSA